MFALKRADLRDLNLIGWVIFALVVTIAIHQSLRESDARDFVYFYSIGHLLNHYSPARLYDFGLQVQIAEAFQRQAPKVGHLGPFAYPPHVAMLFQPFAMLPYWTACRLWLAISLTLYLTGLCLVIKRFCNADLWQRSVVLLFGLLFWPFIPWILLGGQLAAIGFLGMALALYWEDSGRPYLSGFALSICTYKPTLLVLVVPMLIVIRRPKTLVGFAAGAFTFMAAATLAGGPQIWQSYLAASLSYAGGGSHVIPPTLDVTAVARAIPGGTPFVRALFACACGISGAYLVGLWWRARKYAQQGPATLVWATTITWTLLLNLYVPVYDSVQVLTSLIVTSAILIRFARRLFFALCLLLLVSSYVSAWLSGHIGWEILSAVLAAIGILQISACWSLPQESGAGGGEESGPNRALMGIAGEPGHSTA